MNWFDAAAIIHGLGPYLVIGVAGIIFIETAFIPTSFLPGDSLLFVAGLAVAEAGGAPLLALAIPSFCAAAVVGSQVGYYTGRTIGPSLLDKPRGRILNPRTLQHTHRFFDAYGHRAIIFGRFVPIVRALVPMLAGITRVSVSTFITYNIVGAVSWVCVMTVGGFLLGGIPGVRENLELAIIIVIVVTSLPFPLELMREWWKTRR